MNMISFDGVSAGQGLVVNRVLTPGEIARLADGGTVMLPDSARCTRQWVTGHEDAQVAEWRLRRLAEKIVRGA